MEWTKLLSARRFGKEDAQQGARDGRSEYQRDYDRLIFSGAFRRLQNKTQVFPLPGSVFVHNRLTHSLEVSSVGRSLGTDVARRLIAQQPELGETDVPALGAIVAAACLAHDLGNPPFGHAGERAIRTFFSEGAGQRFCSEVPEATWCDLTHFDGNANTFRQLTHHFPGRRKGGFVMTYSTLASVVKYPWPSALAGKKSKFGFFEPEREGFVRIAETLGLVTSDELLVTSLLPRIPQSGSNGGDIVAPLQGAIQNTSPLPGVETPGCNKSPFQGSFADVPDFCPNGRGSFATASDFALTGQGSNVRQQTSSSSLVTSHYHRHPLVYLVEAADDICYEIMDIEDAHKLHVLTDEETCELFSAFFSDADWRAYAERYDQYTDTDDRIAYYRSLVVGLLERACVDIFVGHEREILDGTFSGSLIDHLPQRAREAYKACERVAYPRIYRNRDVLDIDLAGYRIICTLLELFTEAVQSPTKAYSELLLAQVPSQYEVHAERMADRLMAVVDYLSGMTDVYALDLYRKINGHSLPSV